MWNVIQCAVPGRSHINLGIPCQDKTFSTNYNNTQVVALADGAGSAKLSHYGAETVTKFICSELTERFDAYFSESNGVLVKQQLTEKLLKSLNATSKQFDCDIKELASTLLFVAIKGEQFILAHIGDGVIGYLKNDELNIASQPENGEFINTTVFTTSKDVVMSMKLIKGSLGKIQGFVLMSDGTEESLYSKRDQRLADVIKRIMQMSTIISISTLQEQITHSFENVIIKATTDDCSIAMLVRKNREFKGYAKMSNVQKSALLKIDRRTSKRILRRYDNILTFLLDERTLPQIARTIRLKIKYTKRYLDKLCTLNFIEKKGNSYRTVLIMELGDE